MSGGAPGPQLPPGWEAEVLPRFGMAGAPLRPLGAGLINQTWLAGDPAGRAIVLQRLHAVFAAVVNDDIDAVTRHLEARGLTTPRVVLTRDGRTWTEYAGGVWRALTYVPGLTRQHLESAGDAREAGALLGRFHRALADFAAPFRNARPGVHDLARHLATLRAALDEHPDHPRRGSVEPLAAEILRFAGELPPLPAAPPRVVHGDPKISNVIYDAGGRRALCLVDLDTLARMPLAFELGDAFRSWCNPAGEDLVAASFSLPLFEAGIAGYAATAGDLPTVAEWNAVVPGTETICAELAARFCADALHERYFGWDAARFGSRSEHNEVRARSQLNLARSVRAQRAEAGRAVARVAGGRPDGGRVV